MVNQQQGSSTLAGTPASMGIDTGNAIIGTGLLIVAAFLGMGVAGVAFMDWIGEILLVVAGSMMVRGSLGAHPRVGWALVILGPTLFVLPAFLPQFSIVLPAAVTVVLVLGAGTKFANVW